MSTFSELKHDLLALMRVPADEKSLSDGTEVALADNLCLANLDRYGNRI